MLSGFDIINEASRQAMAISHRGLGGGCEFGMGYKDLYSVFTSVILVELTAYNGSFGDSFRLGVRP